MDKLSALTRHMHSTARRKFALVGMFAFAAVLAFMLVCFVAEPPQQSTFACVYATEQIDAASDAPATREAEMLRSQGQAAQSEASDGTDGETIADEDNPLSSGLGGGEPESSSMISFGIVALFGIVAVALFFMTLMRRLNGNIQDMRSMFK